jgi:hypothetical protein
MHAGAVNLVSSTLFIFCSRSADLYLRCNLWSIAFSLAHVIIKVVSDNPGVHPTKARGRAKRQRAAAERPPRWPPAVGAWTVAAPSCFSFPHHEGTVCLIQSVTRIV